MACPKCHSFPVQAAWNNIIGNHKTCPLCSYRFFCDNESIETIEDIHHDMKNSRQILQQLQTCIEDLQKEIRDIKQNNLFMANRLSEIYYAPGMPGSIAAQNSFENTNNT
jgi:hypothetical protein